MTTRSDLAPPVLFDAVLYPNRSLGRNGFVILMLLFGGLCFIGGLLFSLLGAWPVAGFLGLDILLLYGAFRLSYRSGRITESVRLTGDSLTVTRRQPDGVVRRWDLQPYWVRVIIESADDDQCRVILRSHGRDLVLGGFLAPEERRDLGLALDQALADWRTRPRRNG